MADDVSANRFIADFLFPNENVTFAPDADAIHTEIENLEKRVSDKKCPKCCKAFSKTFNFNRHVQSGTCDKENLRKCRECGRVFNANFNLKRHEAECLGGETAQCEICKKRFKSRKFLDLHIARKHRTHCPLCRQGFNSNTELVTHARRHFREGYLTLPQVKQLRKITGKSVLLPDPSSSAPSAVQQTASASSTSAENLPEPTLASTPSTNAAETPPEPRESNFRQTEHRIHRNAGIRFSITVPTGAERHSLLNLFSGRRAQIQWNLDRQLRRWNNVRWYMSVRCRMIRFDSEGNIRDEERPTFRSTSQILLASDMIPAHIDQAYFKVNSSLESFCSSASGWALDAILSLDMFVLRYNPLGGNCGDLDLPQELSNTRALINVTGRPADSKDCFLWAVIAAIHHSPREHFGSVHWSAFEHVRPMYRLPDSMLEGDTVTLE